MPEIDVHGLHTRIYHISECIGSENWRLALGLIKDLVLVLIDISTDIAVQELKSSDPWKRKDPMEEGKAIQIDSRTLK